MALQYRKVVRDAVLGFLAANFNNALSGMGGIYGITPFELDFSDSSTNFAVSHIDPAKIERCQLTDFPAACLYTSEVQANGDVHAIQFSGKLMAHLDLYVRDREGAEGFNTEDLFDAIEDAAVSVLNNRSNHWPAGVIYSRMLNMNRETLIPLGDGFATRIPITMAFEVYVS